MSIDHLLDRIWTPEYTCNEFLCEAWHSITGENLAERLQQFLNGSGDFQRIDEPISPCIVFFSNGPRSSTHVGLFYCDKVLHLTGRGVQFIPLDLISINFRETRFYL